MITFSTSDAVGRSPGVETSLAPVISAGETWSDLENRRGWGARDVWTAPQVQQAGPQAPEPGRRTNELLALSEDVYSFQDACGCVVAGLVCLVAVVGAHSPLVFFLGWGCFALLTLAGLSQLVPAAHVSTEQYDDTLG